MTGKYLDYFFNYFQKSFWKQTYKVMHSLFFVIVGYETNSWTSGVFTLLRSLHMVFSTGLSLVLVEKTKDWVTRKR